MNLTQSLTGATVFVTPRLHCRRWLPADLDAIFAVYSDPEGSRWVDDGQPITRPECEAWLQVTADNYHRRGYGMFALEDGASAQVVGFCGLVHPGGQAEAEVKYALLPACWGRGLASEAVPALLRYGQRQHQLSRVIATVAAENLASQRVLRKSGLVLVTVRQEDDGSGTQVYEWRSG